MHYPCTIRDFVVNDMLSIFGWFANVIFPLIGTPERCKGQSSTYWNSRHLDEDCRYNRILSPIKSVKTIETFQLVRYVS